MNYKIFTSPLSIAVLAALVLVYILIALFTRFMPKAKALPMILGIIGIVLSVIIAEVLWSAILGVFAFSSFWTIKELFEQQERVRKGWFPKNPNRRYPF